MIDKIVLYTLEKKTNRYINMVLICRDSSETNSGKVQVIFGATKPNDTGRDLLPFKRQPICTKDYVLLSMDLHLARKIRHTAFGTLNQEIAWEKTSKMADRFIMKMGRMSSNTSTSSGNSKFNKKYVGNENIHTEHVWQPPIAVLITNSKTLENTMKKAYTNSNE